MDEGGSAFRILTGKPIEKRPTGRVKLRQEDNIRMDLKEISVNSNWIGSAQDRDYWGALLSAALNLQFP